MMQVNTNDDYGKAYDSQPALVNQTLYWRARIQFVRKVYAILTIQLLITVGMTVASMYSKEFMEFQLRTDWLIYTAIGVMLVSEIAIICCKVGRKPPTNYILLFLFTMSEAYLVSIICAEVSEESGKAVVLMAAIMTLAIVVACTAYAMLTKEDFTMKWGIMWVLLMAMLMFGIFAFFYNSDILYCMYCALGVLFFGIYLIIDTQLILGGKRLELTIDEYVAAAMFIYIDIIQIFLKILAMLKK